MDLAAYLDRIGFEGEPRAVLATLQTLQRRHMLAIPYENLDVQLGWPVTTAPAAAFDKLVTRRRGGWCYEMNGVLGWALGEIGFDVTRVEGAVLRATFPIAEANHLVLWVKLPEGPFLADVGLGCGPTAPFAIAEAAFESDGFSFSLETTEDGWWRLNNHPGLRPPTFDFRLRPADEAKLSAVCGQLQTLPESIFVQNLIVQRHVAGGFLSLLGRTLITVGPDSQETALIGSADELVSILGERFGLDEPAAAGLWDQVCARHEAMFGAA